MATSLMELFQVFLERVAGKRRTFITDVRLSDYSVGRACLLKVVFGKKCLVRVQMRLQLNVDVPCGVIHEDATSLVFRVGMLLAV